MTCSPSIRDLLAAWHRHRQVVQKALSIDRRHATSAGSRDCLPVKRVLHVATRKHAGNIRRRRVARSLQITNLVHLELPFEQIRYSACDRSPQTRPNNQTCFPSPVFKLCRRTPVTPCFLRPENLLHPSVPDKLDLLVSKRLLLHDLRRSQLVATMNHINFRGVTRQETSPLPSPYRRRRLRPAPYFETRATDRHTSRTPKRRCRRNHQAPSLHPECPSHFADAPVAMISVSAEIVCVRRCRAETDARRGRPR